MTIAASTLERILALDGNDVCGDCASPRPTWASLNNGMLLCLECAGIHRGFGVDVSFVKSLQLDDWTMDEVNHLTALGGNTAVNDFIGGGPIERYFGYPAALLRESIKALAEGRSAPKSLSEDQKQNIEVSKRRRESRDVRFSKPLWIPDHASSNCSICDRKFTIIFRRHHCRCCGSLVCQICAPKKNTKPIPKLGFREPVRHCRNCFKSSLLKWD